MSENTAVAVQQPDLYHQALLDSQLRDLTSTLEFPMTGLSRKPSYAVREYGSIEQGAWLKISPGPEGAATQWDRDVLIYCISQLIRAHGLQKAGKPRRDDDEDTAADANDEAPFQGDGELRMSFVAHDLLKVCRRGTGKRAYEQLKDALFRLRSTTIETNITANGEREHRGFGWINDFRVVEDVLHDGSRRMKCIEISLHRWVVNQLRQDRSVLAIHPGYFELESGLERRLYQLARKHCGNQKSFTMLLGNLARKVGSEDTLRKFKAALLKVIEDNNIPEYDFTVEDAEVQLEGTAKRRAPKRIPNERLRVPITPRTGPHIGNRILAKVEREQAAYGEAA